MRIRFVGTEKRTNSFGTFMPKEGGRLYDVSEKVGEQLLTVPTLFVPKDAPIQDKAMDRIVEVDESEDAKSEYDDLNMNELKSLCRKRGVMLTRGLRKTEIVQMLIAAEKETTDVVNETGGEEPEEENEE